MAEMTAEQVPRRARELFEKGMIAMERNNLAYAGDMFMAALEVAPQFLKARKTLRAIGLKQARGRGAAARALAVARGLPGLIQGELALRSGRALPALQAAEKLMRLDSLCLPFIRLLGRAAEAAGLPEVAIQTLAAASEAYPDNPELLTWLGRLYTADNQLDAALASFEKVVTLRPHDLQAARTYKDAMARNSMIKGGWVEAAKEGGSFRSVIKDLQEATTLEQEAKFVRGTQGLERLIRDAAANIRGEPDNINHRRTLANLFVEAGRFDDAIRVIEECRRLPSMDDAQLDQLLAGVRLRQFDSEIAELRKNGDQAGANAMQAERNEFRFQDVSGRVERFPNDLPLRFEYGVLLFERGLITEAIQQLQAAQRHPRHRLAAGYYLGLCFRAKEQFDLAREQLEKAATELPAMSDLKKDVLYALGGVLEQLGRGDEALERCYKEIYQADIAYRDVAAKIEAAYRKPHEP